MQPRKPFYVPRQRKKTNSKTPGTANAGWAPLTMDVFKKGGFYMILVKLLGFAMLIGTVAGSVLGLQIVIDRLVAAQRRKRKAARSYP